MTRPPGRRKLFSGLLGPARLLQVLLALLIVKSACLDVNYMLPDSLA